MHTFLFVTLVGKANICLYESLTPIGWMSSTGCEEKKMCCTCFVLLLLFVKLFLFFLSTSRHCWLQVCLDTFPSCWMTCVRFNEQHSCMTPQCCMLQEENFRLLIWHSGALAHFVPLPFRAFELSVFHCQTSPGARGHPPSYIRSLSKHLATWRNKLVLNV